MRELPGAQQGDAWFEHRKGRITGSRFSDLMAVSVAKGREGTPLKARADYRDELVIERISRRIADHYVTRAMERGQEREPEAKRLFEMATGEMIIPVGFVLHPEFDWSGASPDGIVGDAIYECKCPTSGSDYLRWYKSPEVPPEHRDQILWEMVCCEKKRGIFHAYNPDMLHEHMRSVVRILEWDQERIDAMTESASRLNDEIEEIIAGMGLPPTVWNTKGDEVIHTTREFDGSPIDAQGDEFSYLDAHDLTP